MSIICWSPEKVKDYLSERRVALLDISKQRKKLQDVESGLANVEFELREVSEYEEYLKDVMEKLSFAEATLTSIGAIEFTHCPACGIELDAEVGKQHCVVCRSPLDMDRERGRYNQIRLDMEIQARESRQLIAQKESEVDVGRQESRRLRREHEQNLAQFELIFGGGNGPREAFLAGRMNRLGHIEAEIDFLMRSIELAEQIETLSNRRDDLSLEIERLRERNETMQGEAGKRRSIALTKISEFCTSILRVDLERQEEFLSAEVVELNFRNDSMAVDGISQFRGKQQRVLEERSNIWDVFGCERG